MDVGTQAEEWAKPEDYGGEVIEQAKTVDEDEDFWGKDDELSDEEIQREFAKQKEEGQPSEEVASSEESERPTEQDDSAEAAKIKEEVEASQAASEKKTDEHGKIKPADIEDAEDDDEDGPAV